MCLKKNSGEKSISEGDVQDLLENQLQCMTLPDPSEAMFEQERKTLVDQALSTLWPRTVEIIRMRLDDQTFEEIGNTLGISSERVRQLEQRGYRALRHPSRSEPLKELLYD